MDNTSSMNEAFLVKLKGIVEDHLGNARFGVEELANEAGMSRSQIHRKLSELTGKSTTQFIREIRLDYAREMLANDEGTVSEIAYRVGFNSPTYFSTCFHEYHGFPPGEVASDNLNEAEKNNLRERKSKNENAPVKGYSSLIYSAIALLLLISLVGGYYFYQNGMSTEAPVTESIAVLPLHNLTGDEDQEYFVDGLHDALIGELGQLSNLRVISRTSTLRYRDTDSKLPDIAGELKVQNIIEGSVYKADDSVRIQLQLIDVEPEEQHIWAENYARSTGNILVMLSEVTKEIADEVKVTLSPSEDSLLTNPRKVNPEAFKAYLRGRYHLTKFTNEGYEKGISYLLEATRIDPADPLPWARLALGYNTAGHGGEQPPDAFDKAKAAADKALKLDPSLGEIYLARALVDLYQEWDWKSAETKINKTIRFDPNMAEAHAHNSYFLMLKGASVEDVVAEQKLAIKLDPFHPLYQTFLGYIYMWAEDYEHAIKYCQNALELDPKFSLAHYTLGLTYSLMKKHEKAGEAYNKAAEINPNWEYSLALHHAMAGRKNKAREIAAEIGKDPKPIDTWGLAEVYSIVGDYDEAFKWLEDCYEIRFSWYPWFYWHNFYQPLKNDPRFEKHLDRLGLPAEKSLAESFQ